MFKNFSKIFFSICLLLFCLQTKSQIFESHFKMGEKEYRALRYKIAIPHYLNAYKKDSSIVLVTERLANCYRLTKDYENAEIWYANLGKIKKNLNTNDLKYYAEALANNGKYEEAQLISNKIIDIKYKKDYLNNTQDSSRWKIRLSNFNTQFSEYSPVYYKEGLVFTSNRTLDKLVKHIYGWDLSPYNNLFYIPQENIIKNNFNDVNSLQKNKYPYIFNDDDTKNTSNDSRVLNTYNISKNTNTSLYTENFVAAEKFGRKLKSKFHDGPATFSEEGNEIFFTRNHKRKDKNKVYKLKLMWATYANGRWSKPKEFTYNNKAYSIGHPSLSKDGKILFFSSDKPGGLGGSDIYYCIKRENNSWSNPTNLGGLVNTAGEEQFPFVDHEGNLYFASNGKGGFGGLDIFFVPLKDLKPSGPVRNLGVPINSNKDDFGFIINQQNTEGYFSSNRNLNDDIYSFERLPANYLDLIVDVVDESDNPIDGALVKLAASSNYSLEQVNDLNGKAFYEIEPDLNYVIEGSKKGYINQSIKLSTIGKLPNQTLNAKIILSKIPRGYKTVNIDVKLTAKCDSLKKFYYLPEIYYDLDQSYIRPDAVPIMQRLLGLMLADTELKVIIGSHCDSRAGVLYNLDLSKRRAQAAKDYLVSRGVAESRIIATFFGKFYPTNGCTDGVPCPENMQQQNRRSEFQIIRNGKNLSIECGFGISEP